MVLCCFWFNSHGVSKGSCDVWKATTKKMCVIIFEKKIILVSQGVENENDIAKVEKFCEVLDFAHFLLSWEIVSGSSPGAEEVFS